MDGVPHIGGLFDAVGSIDIVCTYYVG